MLVWLGQVVGVATPLFDREKTSACRSFFTRRRLAHGAKLRHPPGMTAGGNSTTQAIPRAPVGDSDVDRDEDEEQWERRVMELAKHRLESARERLERMGIIDAHGKLVSQALPPDMQPNSDTTLETG